MAPTGMLLHNLTAEMDRNLIVTQTIPLTFYSGLFLWQAYPLPQIVLFPLQYFLPNVAMIRSHISSLPSFCFIKCEQGGGEVCRKQEDYMFVQCLAQLPSHGSGLHRLTLFQQWIIMTLQNTLHALFQMDTINSFNFHWDAEL